MNGSRFRKPGKYRVAVLSRRVSQLSDPAHGRLEMVSNILAIDIVPAPAAWVKEQIAEAVTTLDGPATEDLRERRLRAGATLRFLDSPEAALELARHLGSGDDIDSWSMNLGVLGSPYRKQLLPLMEARLTAPDQPVWDRYLDTLSRLSQQVLPGGPARNEYAARLIASLPSKQIEARVISMNTLVDSASRYGRTDTTWLPPLAASIVADFRSLPPRMQGDLLVSRWNIIGGPAMLPVLREIYARPSGAACRSASSRDGGAAYLRSGAGGRPQNHTFRHRPAGPVSFVFSTLQHAAGSPTSRIERRAGESYECGPSGR